MVVTLSRSLPPSDKAVSIPEAPVRGHTGQMDSWSEKFGTVHLFGAETRYQFLDPKPLRMQGQESVVPAALGSLLCPCTLEEKLAGVRAAQGPAGLAWPVCGQAWGGAGGRLPPPPPGDLAARKDESGQELPAQPSCTLQTQHRMSLLTQT